MLTGNASFERRRESRSPGAWQAVADALVAGLCHDLAGRAAALGGILHLVRGGEPADEALVPIVDQEMGRLEEAIRLLRLLPDDPLATAEPMVAGDHLPGLLALHRRHRGLEGVDVTLDDDRTTPPLMANHSDFRRSVLVLLAALSSVALERGHARVRVYTRPATGRAVVGFELEAGGESAGSGAGAPWEGRTGVERATSWVRATLADSGAEVEEAGGGAGSWIEVRFPALGASDRGAQKGPDAKDAEGVGPDPDNQRPEGL